MDASAGKGPGRFKTYDIDFSIGERIGTGEVILYDEYDQEIEERPFPTFHWLAGFIEALTLAGFKPRATDHSYNEVASHMLRELFCD